MEHKVGERFKYRGKTYEVRENKRCIGCAFLDKPFPECKVKNSSLIEDCTEQARKDRKSVIFVKIES